MKRSSLAVTLLAVTLLALCLAHRMCPAQQAAAAAEAPPVTAADVLSLKGTKFYLDNQPFAEISFNKFDLLWTVWDGVKKRERTHDASTLNAAIAKEDAELNDLQQMGFRTLRIFGAPYLNDPATLAQALGAPRLLLETMDTVLELCNRHHLRVVFSLGLNMFQHDEPQPAAGGAPYALYADPASAARQHCYAYIDLIVNRYKNNHAILMWEISNEPTDMSDIGVWKGRLSPTLPQVAEFLNTTATHIKHDDPLRLVSDGGSHLRESAWHMWQHDLPGGAVGAVAKDSPAQYAAAYAAYFKHSAIDVIDTHYYALREGGYQLDAGGSRSIAATPAVYKAIGDALGKGSIFGEFGPLPSGFASANPPNDPKWFKGYHDANAAKWVQTAADEIVQAHIPITYWWAYQSDRAVDQHDDPVTFSRQTTPDLMKIIVDANQRLRKSLGAPAAP